MKVLILVALCLAAAAGHSQTVTYNRDSAAYEISDTNLTGGKPDLHRKAQSWAIEKFGDAKDVILLDDMDSGELTGKAAVPLKGAGQKCTFTFKVASKDRQFHAMVHNIATTSGSDTTQFLNRAQGKNKLSGKVEATIHALLTDLHTKMKSESDFSTPLPPPSDK